MEGESCQTDQPTTTQVPNQGYKLTHLHIHLIYELLEHVKGLDHADPKPQDLHDITGNNRLSKESQ